MGNRQGNQQQGSPNIVSQDAIRRCDVSVSSEVNKIVNGAYIHNEIKYDQKECPICLGAFEVSVERIIRPTIAIMPNAPQEIQPQEIKEIQPQEIKETPQPEHKQQIRAHLRVLGCGHYYHARCFAQWEAERIRMRIGIICPLCQRVINERLFRDDPSGDEKEASLRSFEWDVTYMPDFKYQSKLYISPTADGKLDAGPVYTCYKLARFLIEDDYDTRADEDLQQIETAIYEERDRLVRKPKYILSKDIVVLLTLYVRSGKTNILLGNTGEQIHPSRLQPLQEYCTGNIIVARLQFIGDTRNIINAKRYYENGKGFIVSNFDANFKYELGHEIIEPNFGKRGRGCVQGIHLFTSVLGAFRYAKAKGFFGNSCVSPAITCRVYQPRAVDEERDNEALLRSVGYMRTTGLIGDKKDENKEDKNDGVSDEVKDEVKDKIKEERNKSYNEITKLFAGGYINNNAWYRLVRK